MKFKEGKKRKIEKDHILSLFLEVPVIKAVSFGEDASSVMGPLPLG